MKTFSGWKQLNCNRLDTRLLPNRGFPTSQKWACTFSKATWISGHLISCHLTLTLHNGIVNLIFCILRLAGGSSWLRSYIQWCGICSVYLELISTSYWMFCGNVQPKRLWGLILWRTFRQFARKYSNGLHIRTSTSNAYRHIDDLLCLNSIEQPINTSTCKNQYFRVSWRHQTNASDQNELCHKSTCVCHKNGCWKSAHSCRASNKSCPINDNQRVGFGSRQDIKTVWMKCVIRVPISQLKSWRPPSGTCKKFE